MAGEGRKEKGEMVMLPDRHRLNKIDKLHDGTGITFLPSEDTLNYQLESGLSHFPYEKEKEIFSCFLTGNVEKFDQLLEEIQISGISLGPTASSEDQSLRYAIAISAAIACRYCVEGGMLQLEAYSRCDSIVRTMDETANILSVDQWNIYLGKLRELVIRMREIHSGPSVRPEIRLACNYVLNNLHKGITVTQMAEVASLSVSYFKSVFQKELGITPSAYVMQQKLRYACQLLNSTDQSIANIAYTLGFCSQSHFTKMFRQVLGKTPSEYRKDNKEI